MLAGIMLMPACNSRHDGHDHEVEAKDHAEIAKDKKEVHTPDEIVFSQEKAKAAGLKTDEVRPGNFSGVIHVSGKIMPASGEEATLSATVAGIVSLNRSITEGAQIGKGAPVFTISTSGLQDGDVSKRASIAYETAKKEYERAEKLIADKIITQKEYEAAKSNFETARLAREAVASGSDGKGISVSAPIGGYVKECLVKDGDFVNVGQPMMTVTQNRKLYLRAEVPEREYGSLGKISSAKFKTAYDDGIYSLSDLRGRMVAFGKTSGDTSPFVPVTFEFDNIGGLIPGSYADIYLLTTPRENVIAIPVAALTEEQGIMYVYTQEDEDCYSKKEVNVGDTDGEFVEILSGLTPGDRIVTEGAIHVKLASASAVIPAHTHNH